MSGEELELPLGGTVATFRKTVAIEAQRFHRKALTMQSEIERGVADESFDPLALTKIVDRAGRYAWALASILEYLRRDDAYTASESDAPGLSVVAAHLAQQCLAYGEPSDRTLIADVAGAGEV